MRRLFAIAVLLASAAPTLGAECSYVTAEGDRLVQEPGQVTVSYNDGSSETCTLKGNGPGVSVLAGICANGADWPYFMIASEPEGYLNIVIFINTAWYEDCA